MVTIETNHWHPGYMGAMGLELRANKSDLEFDEFHTLSREALEIDLLIIKKSDNRVLQNEIGAIFRQFNVTEYKSPGDDMNLSNYVKTVGYACILKGTEGHVDDIPLSELTVTLVRENYPDALFKAVKREGGSVEKKADGIYYIHGLFVFPTQVLVTRKLDSKLHPSLRILSRKAEKKDIEAFIQMANTFTDSEDRQNANRVLRISINANAEVYDNLKRRNSSMSDAIRHLLRDEIKEERADAEKKLSIFHVHNIMDSFNISAKQAMDVLKIPAAKQAEYAALL
ncbi:MAG: hypothetical protein IJT77_07850 [Clostridia bacterium]|nr:hypothetical protein [Clostridia bacterium]